MLSSFNVIPNHTQYGSAIRNRSVRPPACPRCVAQCFAYAPYYTALEGIV